jgi:hypothetical protein
MPDRFARPHFKQQNTQPGRKPRRPGKNRRSPFILVLLILLWSACLGWGFATASDLPTRSTPAQRAELQALNSEIGTVDVVPSQHQFGKELYLENCATCHIGVPPEVLPTQTWRQLIQDPQHYGQIITPLVDPTRLLVWNYLRTFSRPTTVEESTPYRVADSRYFKALHPKLRFPQKVTLNSCATCHPGVSQYDFRSLKPEWQTDPPQEKGFSQ